MLPGYTMYGLCINNNSLDYLIGIEEVTGDIHVIRFELVDDSDNPGKQMA